ncbi:zf-TFIIB domain-containing protein [Lysobacter sp. S4-A87]|uniref:zf-TFIIB domain-containing protein n=1 Tax=Lysobacter sp. S4-A87 TaxID=2925843 RepID=UPI0021113CBA|nr:zf-TFIIB domain-containing protein [Lysobacter sp. S4-A87]
MQCPKCSSPMQAIDILSSRSQRCTHCSGLWLVMGEERLLKAQAEIVDTGDAAVGAQYNHVDRIKCPTCADSQLVRMVDPQQPHIWFESCSFCFGRFYDAGEFRDFAERTLLEFFQDMDAPERV